ncbi:MAG TPA: hypothetical protein VHM02_02930 [Thermoanaerobaculia bacterium]|nr:hypothetical protein [Thermoanaerobaculia bacterium]
MRTKKILAGFFAILSSGGFVELVLACSTTADCGASCSTPAGSWATSCSSGETSATCTWTESCGEGCTRTISQTQSCPGSGQGPTPFTKDP